MDENDEKYSVHFGLDCARKKKKKVRRGWIYRHSSYFYNNLFFVFAPRRSACERIASFFPFLLPLE